VPEEILSVRGPEEEVKNLQSEGFAACVLQPVQMAPFEGKMGLDFFGGIEATESATAVNSKSSRCELIVGRPVLGTHGTKYPYREDAVTVVRSLSQDAALARKEKAALFYMGHGNRSTLTDAVYREVVAEMRRQYPDIFTVMSLVEGSPSLDEAVAELKAEKVAKIVLKPFMIVAGDHVRKDMIGKGSDTLKTRLEKEGLTVLPVISGLGEIISFAEIFAQHAADAARDAGIQLT
jgi:sirohydrochlorin cobaltochelatase